MGIMSVIYYINSLKAVEDIFIFRKKAVYNWWPGSDDNI